MLAHNEGNAFALENAAVAPCRDATGAFVDIVVVWQVYAEKLWMDWKVEFWVAKKSHAWEDSQG